MREIDLTSKNFLRDVIGNVTAKLGEENEKVVVVNADLMGSCRTRTFNEEFPNRSFNVGIAEQQMISDGDLCWCIWRNFRSDTLEYGRRWDYDQHSQYHSCRTV